jgi:hypothetical protein
MHRPLAHRASEVQNLAIASVVLQDKALGRLNGTQLLQSRETTYGAVEFLENKELLNRVRDFILAAMYQQLAHVGLSLIWPFAIGASSLQLQKIITQSRRVVFDVLTKKQ